MYASTDAMISANSSLKSERERGREGGGYQSTRPVYYYSLGNISLGMLVTGSLSWLELLPTIVGASPSTSGS